jgi:hypothetical protein
MAVKKIKLFLFLVLFVGLVSSCGDKFQPKKEIRTDCVLGSEPIRKVLFIGWDGVRTDALIAAQTPCIDSLLIHSYYNWSTDRGEHTVSVPGWSTILHGVWPAKHGLTDNTFSSNNYKTYGDIFTLAKQVKPNLSVATLSNWDDFLRITEMENYIGLILDERNDHYTIGYRQTSDLQKLKEWKKEMLECSNVTDCKILKVEEIE